MLGGPAAQRRLSDALQLPKPHLRPADLETLTVRLSNLIYTGLPGDSEAPKFETIAPEHPNPLSATSTRRRCFNLNIVNVSSLPCRLEYF